MNDNEIRINYVLRQAHLARLEALGNGNVTEGLRCAVTAWNVNGQPAITGGDVGHPKRGDELMVKRNFRINAAFAALIAEAGDGNASRGLRRIIEWEEQR